MPDAQALALLDAARRDRLTLRILLREAESPLENTLFHAQQAIEKSLKVALVCRRVIFPRTHDLVQLAELATASGLALPVSRDLLMRLAPYAVEFRYLGVAAPAVGRDEAGVAVDAAVQWAERSLGVEAQ